MPSFAELIQQGPAHAWLFVPSVAVGAAAALSVRHATKRWMWFSMVARRAPYVSGLLIIAVGLYVGWHGWIGLAARGA